MPLFLHIQYPGSWYHVNELLMTLQNNGKYCFTLFIVLLFCNKIVVVGTYYKLLEILIKIRRFSILISNVDTIFTTLNSWKFKLVFKFFTIIGKIIIIIIHTILIYFVLKFSTFKILRKFKFLTDNRHTWIWLLYIFSNLLHY